VTRTIEIASNAAASSWTDITAVIPWPATMWGGQAHQCEVGTSSGFDLDDDAGGVVLPAKRVVRCIEDATSPDTVLFRGRVSDKGLARGTLPTDDAKQFDASLDDNNSSVYGIPVDAWVRPAETGRARVVALAAAFLNGSPRASTVIDYSTYVPNSHTVTMPAKTYDATDVAGVLKDCATTEGKQVFVTVDDELFYDIDTSTAYAATLSITDSSPDLSTEFPPIDSRGSEQGNEFFTGATLRYGTSSSVSDVRAGAESDHDYWRTVFYDSDAKASTAAQRLATMLDNQSIEELRYTCSLRLEETQVDLIKYGHTVSFRSAAAGVLTPVTLRVATLYWEPVGDGVYLAHLELGVPEKLAPRVRRGSPPDPADLPPFEPTYPTGECESSGYDYTAGGTYGGLGPPYPVIVGLDTRWHVTSTDFIQYVGFGGYENEYPEAGIDEDLGNGGACGGVYTSGGQDNLLAGHHITFTPVGPGTLTVVTAIHAGGLYGSCGADASALGLEAIVSGTAIVVDSAVGVPGDTMTVTIPDAGYCNYFVQLTATGGTWAFVSATWSPLPINQPTPGQQVNGPCFLGDGSTTAFTTAYPYLPGTLGLIVNGLDWLSHVTETDPTTGDGDIAYAPALGATVCPRYKAA
jgi:hypothetical protein